MALAISDVTGLVDKNGAKGWWLALLLGLMFTSLTAVTGLLDWLQITWRSPLWWTATYHMLVMVSATVFFAIAAAIGHGDYVHGNIGAGQFALTAIGWCLMAVGGWLGGTIVFVYGMRVLGLPEEPAARAVSPLPKPEKEAAG
jgi:hypothetical protein